MPLCSLKSKEQHDLPNHATDKYCSPHQCVRHNNNDHRYPREMLCVKHVATMCIEYELIIGALQQLVLTGLMSVWFIGDDLSRPLATDHDCQSCPSQSDWGTQVVLHWRCVIRQLKCLSRFMKLCNYMSVTATTQTDLPYWHDSRLLVFDFLTGNKDPQVHVIYILIRCESVGYLYNQHRSVGLSYLK